MRPFSFGLALVLVVGMYTAHAVDENALLLIYLLMMVQGKIPKMPLAMEIEPALKVI